MKVGTDGVLLGAWTEIPSEPGNSPGSNLRGKKILDIGTGTGVIALMLAQKLFPDTVWNSEKKIIIDAIDSNESSCTQARENIAISRFKGKINVIHCSLQQFLKKVNHPAYDLIVSNPPFFKNSLKSPDTFRNQARHSDTAGLSSEKLISSVLKLLTADGKFFLILPETEGENFIIEAKKSFLFCNKLSRVFPKPGKECIRMLMQFQRYPVQLKESTLTIETGKEVNDYSEEYKLMTREFYLNF